MLSEYVDRDAANGAGYGWSNAAKDVYDGKATDVRDKLDAPGQRNLDDLQNAKVLVPGHPQRRVGCGHRGLLARRRSGRAAPGVPDHGAVT